MSFKHFFGLAVIGIIISISVPINAGVLRINQTTSFQVDTTTESKLIEDTTTQDDTGFQVHSKDEDATIEIATASENLAPGTIKGIEITLETLNDKTMETDSKQSEEYERANKNQADKIKNESALSEDETPSLKINAPESDDLAKEILFNSAEMIQGYQKSSKLLLLSTPKLAREQEENIVETEGVDVNTEVSTDETTEFSTEINMETEKLSQKDVEPKTIFEKKTEENTIKTIKEMKDNEDKSRNEGKHDDEMKKLSVGTENTPDTHNDNSLASVLIETEPEYVIFDSGSVHEEHFGSFTHIDSDEHAQPIVHSVEVVPSHFEEPLLFTSSYVHAW